MKKFIYVMFVALMATVSFTSCDETEEMTDTELYAAILSNAAYSGADADEDVATLVFTQSSYILTYTEYGVFSTGTWDVVEGELVLTSSDTSEYPSATGEIASEGDDLTITAGTVVFTMEAVDLEDLTEE